MNFKEMYVYTKYKDTDIVNSNYFKKLVNKIDGIDSSKIYIKIINYQIKKYGNQLDGTHVKLKTDNKVKELSRKRKQHNQKYHDLRKETNYDR